MDKVPDVLSNSPSSRRNFLKYVAMASTGVALGGIGFPLAAHAANDDPPTIIGVALTAEYLAVTFVTNALGNASTIGFTSSETTTLQAIAAEEALHVAYLRAYGAAAPYGGPFAFPSGTFTTRSGFANTAVLLETAFVAAYMAAVRDLAADGRDDLAQLAFQIGAVEAEHRALARVIGGFVPFSDVAFEANLIPTVATAATFLTNTGFLAPSTGNSYAYTDANQSQALSYAHLLTQTTP